MNLVGMFSRSVYSLNESLKLCFLWLAFGNKWTEIGERMNRSERSVKHALKKLLQKAGVGTISAYNHDELRLKVAEVIEQIKAKIARTETPNLDSSSCPEIPEELVVQSKYSPLKKSIQEVPDSLMVDNRTPIHITNEEAPSQRTLFFTNSVLKNISGFCKSSNEEIIDHKKN